MNYEYIIIEDQKPAFDNLQQALSIHKQYRFVGHARSVDEGIRLYLDQMPDMVFLDVDLHGEIGFDFIRKLKLNYAIDPHVFLTTAFDQFGKQAVNEQVLYFLSKPIDGVELAKALRLYERQCAQNQHHLVVKTHSGVHLILFSTIMYLQADRNYSLIYTVEGQPVHVAKPLKYFFEKLPDYFIRSHKSYIVNKHFVQHINTTLGLITLKIEPKTTIDLGRSYLANMKKELKF